MCACGVRCAVCGVRSCCAMACRPEALFLLRLLGKMFGANQQRTTGTPTKRPHHQRAQVVINLAPSTQRACWY